MGDGIKILLIIVVVLALIYIGASGFVDCYSNSAADTFFGKMTDCSG